MKFSATFELATVDSNAFSRALESTLREALARVIYEYLQAVLSRIPVWSGAEQATFLNLAKQISYNIPISPVAWDGKLNQISVGERCGTGNLKIDVTKGQYGFEYSNSLPHLTYNEYKDGNANKNESGVYSHLKNPGPYHFQELGANAFKEFAQTVRLPSPFKSLKIKTLRVGSRSIL